MGYVGAGGDVEPEYEQVPVDGLEQIELAHPIGIVLDPIGFLVRGESMMPRFNDGDVAIVERQQTVSIEYLIGDEAVVRTLDGHRFLKRVMPGPADRPGSVNLVSLNAPTLEGVYVAWASQVRLILPRAGLRRLARSSRKATAGRPHAGRSERR